MILVNVISLDIYLKRLQNFLFSRPNIGFLKQLCLFESMGKRVDVTSSEYKSYRAKQEQLIYYRSFCEQGEFDIKI